MEKVGQGIFAPQSAAAATALEQMMQDEQERGVAFSVLAQEIRARMEAPYATFIAQDDAFAPLGRLPIAAQTGPRAGDE